MGLRIPIADRYIVKEILAPFLLGVGAFVVILVGDILYTLAEYIIVKRVPLDVVVKLLAYKMPAMLVITLPVSTLLGTLLGLGRLANDRELQAMRLSGMSLQRIFAPALGFGLLMTGLTFVTNESIAPWANHNGNNLIRHALFSDVFPQVRAHVFFRGPGNRFFYVDSVDETQHILRNVLIYEVGGVVPKLVTAQLAHWDHLSWSLLDGVVREFTEDGFTRYEAHFDAMEIPVGVDEASFFDGQKTPEEMTASELQRYLTLFGSGSVGGRFAVEYHRKFAVPFASVIFALIAAPLSVSAAHGGRFLGVGLSITLVFIYYVVMSIARAMGGTGALAPVLAAWAPNLLFGSGGLTLWAREEGWLRHLPGFPPAVRLGASR